MDVCVWMCACVYMNPDRGQKGVSDPVELKLHEVEPPLVWVLILWKSNKCS